MSMKTILLVILLFLFTGHLRSWFIPEVVVAANCPERESLESGENKIHLLELFTSEGCSSCPPAEKWLNSLYKDENLFKTFVPIAFHVDYWNYLGHPDPFSKSEFSQRQRQYASQWSRGSVYTPGFVKDGEEWRNFSRFAPSGPGKKVGNLRVKFLGNKKYEVSFKGVRKDAKAGFESGYVFGAFLIHGIENKISRGENRGKTLKHNFVAIDLQREALKEGKAILTLSQPNLSQKDQSLVFWVTSGSSLNPVQVVGGCLKEN